MSDDKVISLFSDAYPQPRLSEEEVTVERLKIFLTSAVLDYEIHEDGDIYIKDGVDFPFWLSVENDSKLIRFLTHWPAEHCSIDQVNQLNAKLRFSQFALDGERVLANYYLPFRYGIDSRHVVIMARHFGKICRIAYDEVRDTTADGSPE
ncbi:MAG: YbjN domain-containing protein [Hyphomicrobiaceae bacterium]